MKKLFLNIGLIALVGATIFTTGCTPEPTPTPEEGKGKVMIIHASPNAPTVNLFLDNSKINTAEVPFEGKTAYLDVKEGDRAIRVEVASNNAVAINVPAFKVTKDKVYSIFAADSVSKISPVVFEDNLAAPAAGKGHVRILHLSPNTPAVDLYVDDAKVASNIAFKQGLTFTPLSVGNHKVDVRVAGTPATSPAALSVPAFAVAEGKIYTVYAKGFLGGTGAQALGVAVINNN